MPPLTIRLPDDERGHLKAVARSDSIGINRLMADIATVLLTHCGPRVHFDRRAGRGSGECTPMLRCKHPEHPAFGFGQPVFRRPREVLRPA